MPVSSSKLSVTSFHREVFVEYTNLQVAIDHLTQDHFQGPILFALILAKIKSLTFLIADYYKLNGKEDIVSPSFQPFLNRDPVSTYKSEQLYTHFFKQLDTHVQKVRNFMEKENCSELELQKLICAYSERVIDFMSEAGQELSTQYCQGRL